MQHQPCPALPPCPTLRAGAVQSLQLCTNHFQLSQEKTNSLLLVQGCVSIFGKAISKHNDLGRLWSVKQRKKQQGQAGTRRYLTN